MADQNSEKQSKLNKMQELGLNRTQESIIEPEENYENNFFSNNNRDYHYTEYTYGPAQDNAYFGNAKYTYSNRINEVPNTMGEFKRRTKARICSNCQTTSTPSWRRGGNGKILLCNACGLYQKLHNRPRPFSVASDGKTKAMKGSSERSACVSCHSICSSVKLRVKGHGDMCEECYEYYKSCNGHYYGQKRNEDGFSSYNESSSQPRIYNGYDNRQSEKYNSYQNGYRESRSNEYYSSDYYGPTSRASSSERHNPLYKSQPELQGYRSESRGYPNNLEAPSHVYGDDSGYYNKRYDRPTHIYEQSEKPHSFGSENIYSVSGNNSGHSRPESRSSYKSSSSSNYNVDNDLQRYSDPSEYKSSYANYNYLIDNSSSMGGSEAKSTGDMFLKKDKEDMSDKPYVYGSEQRAYGKDRYSSDSVRNSAKNVNNVKNNNTPSIIPDADTTADDRGIE